MADMTVNHKGLLMVFGLSILVFGGIFIAAYGRYGATGYVYADYDEDDEIDNLGVDVKVILFWTKFYGTRHWLVDPGRVACGNYHCYLSYDRGRSLKASALMFHHRVAGWLDRLPTRLPRLPEQRWVLYNRESTWWDPKGRVLNKANNLMNWTMGFRKDNDITIPTAVVTKGQFEDGFDPNKNYLEGKTGEIVSLMSACTLYGHIPGFETRKKYMEYLVDHGLKFDMYGACGKSCGETFSSCARVLRKYKFVIAFENSLCDEYISEKPYRNGLMQGVVPVVMSGANLSNPNVLPPGSFIDAGQFTSVAALSEFLKQVGSDPKLYNKYFEWRKEWNIELISINEGQDRFSQEYFCPLCRKLHEDHKPKILRNVQEWYERQKCREYPQMNP